MEEYDSNDINKDSVKSDRSLDLRYLENARDHHSSYPYYYDNLYKSVGNYGYGKYDYGYDYSPSQYSLQTVISKGIKAINRVFTGDSDVDRQSGGETFAFLFLFGALAAVAA